MGKSDYWYLASPYSKYPGGLDEAYKVALEAASMLLRHRVRAFSPIVYTHPIALQGLIDPRDHKIWLWQDQAFIDNAVGLIVLQAEGWGTSYGVQFEIGQFANAEKPIHFMIPGLLPLAFR